MSELDYSNGAMRDIFQLSVYSCLQSRGNAEPLIIHEHPCILVLPIVYVTSIPREVGPIGGFTPATKLSPGMVYLRIWACAIEANQLL